MKKIKKRMPLKMYISRQGDVNLNRNSDEKRRQIISRKLETIRG